MDKKLFNLITVFVFALSAVMPAHAMLGRLARGFGRYAGALGRRVGQQALRAVQTSTRASRKTRFNWQQATHKKKRNLTRNRVQAKQKNNLMQRAKRYLPVAGVAAAGVTAHYGLKNDVECQEDKPELLVNVTKMLDDGDWVALNQWLKTNDMDEELKSEVAKYCVENLMQSVRGNYNVAIGLTPLAACILMQIIHQGRDGMSFLMSILENSIDAIAVLTPVVVENFVEIAKDYWGGGLLTGMIYHKNHDPEVDIAVAFASVAAQHFTELILGAYDGDHNGLILLKKIVERNPEAADLFAPLALQHFSQLVKDHWYGGSLLSEIIDKSSNAATVLTPVVLENSAELIKDSDAYWLLVSIIQKSPDAAAALTPVVLENSAELIKDGAAYGLLDSIIQKSPDAAVALTPAVLENSTELIKDKSGRLLLIGIAQQNADAVEQIVPLVIDNFNWLAKNWGAELITTIMDKSQEAKEVIPELFARNFLDLSKNCYGLTLLKSIIDKSPEAAKIFTPLLVKYFAVLPNGFDLLSVLKGVMDEDPAAIPQFMQLVQATVPQLMQLGQDDFKKIVREGSATRLLLNAIMQRNEDAAKAIAQLALKHFGLLSSSCDGKSFLVDVLAYNIRYGRYIDCKSRRAVER